jgi:DNA helicase IV
LSSSDEIGREQRYVSMLYDKLDHLREQTPAQLAPVLRQTGGTHQARSEREATVARYNEQLSRYNAVENGLCFGRLDFHDGERRYIGRIGLFDEDHEYEPLLLDWRAPAARPFYLATAVSPDGVRRRRHIRTKRRKVVGVDDEVLDLSSADAPASDGITGETALLAALNATRTGRMRDIVETIQAEQDRVIRADPHGVLVVQGGPGTGKTAVALHRAAYLLYTYRQQLSTRGVLIVGPNITFLRYISQVLPSLAETGVLLATLGGLYPGVTARRPEPPEVAEIKGRPVMAEVLAAAVRDRQRVPEWDQPIEIEYERETYRLDRAACVAARERARRSGRLHNLARPLFAVEIVHALTKQVAERIGTDPFAFEDLGSDDAPNDPNLLDAVDTADIRRDLAEHPDVLAALDWMWPILTPQQLVAGLFAADDRLAAAAPQLTHAERALLRRAPGGGWAPADVPLLDEAAELLGQDDSAAGAATERDRQARIAYAQGILDIAAGSESFEFDDEPSEILEVTDLLDAERLAERHEDPELLSTAQRAAADRRWAFGHVIVDEAQELSAMAWRLLMRRCPSRSMTIVGDVAQTGDLAGVASWRQMLEPYVADRWRLTELTVNYRTSAEIMDAAAGVLASIDPSLQPPSSPRRTGVHPWARPVEPAQLGDLLVEAVFAESAEVGDGRLGVIVPADRAAELGRLLAGAVPEVAVGEQPDLESRVVLLTVRQAKGLEFDSVLVVDPDLIVVESPRGLSDLYVALTRATQRLGVLGDVSMIGTTSGELWSPGPAMATSSGKL